ncbi:unnamed protein product [Linum tenue]|uniref:Uncharacterized protein n=1 Tax=Linum tenue TaxID=586396 RepID=A0AAV0GPG8_9ROSI|nr:unnamed protein product [Linum tenue]
MASPSAACLHPVEPRTVRRMEPKARRGAAERRTRERSRTIGAAEARRETADWAVERRTREPSRRVAAVEGRRMSRRVVAVEGRRMSRRVETVEEGRIRSRTEGGKGNQT